MMFVWSLAVLVLCGRVAVPGLVDASDDALKTGPEHECLELLLQKLTVRVEKLEKACEDQGQSA